jgi:hypothetical protein
MSDPSLMLAWVAGHFCSLTPQLSFWTGAWRSMSPGFLCMGVGVGAMGIIALPLAPGRGHIKLPLAMPLVIRALLAAS